MIDTDKMRGKHGHTPGGRYICDGMACRLCAVDALCDEVERLRADRDSWRRVAERLEREKQEETTGGPEQ